MHKWLTLLVDLEGLGGLGGRGQSLIIWSNKGSIGCMQNILGVDSYPIKEDDYYV